MSKLHLDKRAADLAEAAAPGGDDELLSTVQVAAWLGVSTQWVEIARLGRHGPPFKKLGPDRVSHLVLSGGFIRAGYSIPETQFEAHADHVVANWGSGQMMKNVVRTTGDQKDLAILGKFERMSCSPGAFRALMVMNRRIDVTPILQNVRVPTLVLHSRTDAVVPVSEGRKLAAAIPGSKYIEYEDLPYACFTTDCEQLIADIEEFVTGERSKSTEEADRALATVLFTDIVNSTTRAAEMGDRRWRELLNSHDRLAKQTVERHRGRLVKTRETAFWRHSTAPVAAFAARSRLAQRHGRSAYPYVPDYTRAKSRCAVMT